MVAFIHSGIVVGMVFIFWLFYLDSLLKHELVGFGMLVSSR